MVVQSPGLEGRARLGREFGSPRIRSDSLMLASRTAADPRSIQEWVCVLGKVLDLGMGDKHRAGIISACTYTTRTAFSEVVSCKICSFGVCLAKFKGPLTHYPWLSQIELTLPTPLGWGWASRRLKRGHPRPEHLRTREACSELSDNCTSAHQSSLASHPQLDSQKPEKENMF